MRATRRSFTLGLSAAFAAFSKADAMAQKDQNASPSLRGTFTVGPPIISEFERRRRMEGRLWAEGYTQSELDMAQERYALVFPPDLVSLLRERRPVLGYDYRSDDKEIRAMLKHPLETLLFDVESNGLWWSEWGARPKTEAARAKLLAEVIGSAPRLIPLVSHRYLPTEPYEAENPVFSVMGSDTIYYGANLLDYFEREFVDYVRPIPHPIKHIRFWSDLVERNT